MVSHEDILKELKGGKFRPIYLLMGEEPYPIDVVSDYIEAHALTDDEKTFNQMVVYGVDASARQIALECEQYPTFAARRVVIVKEAQGVKDLKDLEAYASRPSETTVLVLCYKYKSVDKRLKFVKNIEQSGGVVMETKKLYDNQMGAWIAHYASSLHLSIEEKAIELLAEFVGTNMSNAVSAFEKIKAAVGPDVKTVTADMVSEHVGISKEYNAFELRDALFSRNAPKAFRIVKAFGQNEKQYPVQAIFAALHMSFQKLFNYTFIMVSTHDQQKAIAATGERSPYTVQKVYEPAARNYTPTQCMQILGLINKYDMRSKGFEWPETSNRDMLVDLISYILR